MNMREQGSTLDEQRLSEMLHRVTPEPPRPVTVEDIAIRLANQAAPPRRDRTSPGRNDTAVLHIGKRGGGGRRWAPALAAASVVVVIGASAGIAVALTGHHSKTPTTGAGATMSSAANSTSPASDNPTSPQPGASHPAEPRTSVAGGLWGAELIDHDALMSHTLTGGAGSLFAFTADGGYLLRLSPANGDILQQIAISAPANNPPVVVGNTVWVADWSGGSLVLHSYNATTLASGNSIAVPASTAAGQGEGVLAAGPDGNLYVATGSGVAVVDPSSGSVLRHIPVSGGQAESVAVSPDGSRLYVGANNNGSFDLVTYSLPGGAELGGQGIADGAPGGYLIATSGGVWGVVGTQMTQRVWYAPGGDLEKTRYVTAGEDGGLDSVATYANGVVWVGGTRQLECLDPATGKALAVSAIPADGGVPEHFGSVTFVGGAAYATYQDLHSQLVGVTAVTPPSACAA